VYGRTNPGLTASYSGFVNGDTSAVVSGLTLATTATTGSGVGTYPITASSASASNYSITYVAGSLTVTPAALTISADSKSTVYGQGNPGLTASYAGFVNGDTSAVVSGLTLSTTATDASGVGTYSITASGASANNYSISYVAGSLSVTPAAMTITADSKTSVYGSANPALTASYAGFVNGDTSAVVSGLTLTTTATAASGVGTYPITASGGSASNYSISYIAGSLSVTAAPLTITADDKSTAYGSANPALTASYAGFVNGDTSAVVSGLILSTAATTVSGVGSYPITASGASAANYSISYAGGTLSITPAPLTPVVTVNDKVYDTTTGATIATRALSGTIIGTDNVQLSGGTAAFCDPNVGTNKPVTVTGLSLTGADQGNYALTTTTVMTNAGITAGPVDHLAVAAAPTVAAGVPFTVTVTAQDAFNNTVTGYAGTVHFTSTDPQAVLPADYTFATGDVGTRQFSGVILDTLGNQTITAMDTLFNVMGNAAIAVMGPTAYYVSPTGSDTNNGTSPSTAWQTIGRVNQQVYGPGDSINFLGDASYSGSLLFGAQDAGTAANPIRVTSYGIGVATIQAGTGVGILLQDTGGFTISNLTITGSGMDTNRDYGIHVLDDLAGSTVLQHIYIDHVDVSGFGNYGVILDCPSSTSGYQDIQITYSQLHSNLYGGMITLMPYYYDHSLTTEFIQGFYMGHVQAYDNPGSSTSSLPSGNGLLVGGVNGGLVERCEVHDNGGPNARGNVGGIYVSNSTAVVVQYNEAYNNHTGTTTDGDGFDLDWDTINCTLQYNYSHNNDGVGFLLIGNNALHQSYPPQTGNTVRYDISENDARKNSYGSISVVGPVDNAEVYNNTIYLSSPSSGSPACVEFYNWTGSSVHFRNNIFQVTGGLKLVNTNGTQAGTDLLFQGNDYYSTGSSFHINYNGVDYGSLAARQTNTGQEQLNGNNVGFSVNPRLTTPGQGGTIGNADQLDTLTAYKLQSSSAVKNAGLDLMVLFGINPGTHDFYGHAIPDGSGFSIGADDEPLGGDD
jgi:hypothetical protein